MSTAKKALAIGGAAATVTVCAASMCCVAFAVSERGDTRSVDEIATPEEPAREPEEMPLRPLHQANMDEWRAASDADREATAADFAVAWAEKKGEQVPNGLLLEVRARQMVDCLNEAGRDGVADSQQVAAMGAMCGILMEW